MRRDRLHEALTVAAREVPPPDLARAAWGRGRQVRRRQRATAAVVGVAGSLAVLGAGAWLASTWAPESQEVAPAATETWSSPSGAEGSPELAAWVQRKAACYEAHGFDARLVDGTGLDVRPREVSPSPGYSDTSRLCEARVGSPPPADGAFTDDQLLTLRQRYVEGRDCLAAAGHEVAPAPDPEAFITGWRGAEADPDTAPPWNPWADVDRVSLLVACPPPAEVPR